MEHKQVVSTPEFDNQVKALSKPKRNPKLSFDLAIFKQKLSVGEVPHKRARGVGSAPIYGARVQDSSTGQGKRGGFRVLYFEGAEKRILLFIDRRRELDTWPTAVILRMLKESGLWSPDRQG